MPATIEKPDVPLTPMSLTEFVDHVRANVDFDCYDSLARVAPQMQALAANKSFFVEQIVKQLKDNRTGVQDRGNPYGSNSLIIHQDERFFIRLNFWKPEGEVADGTEEFFAYEYPHDHNFDFVTVGCHGPGYKTLLFEYEYNKVIGYAGEPVTLHYLGEEVLTEGKVMLFRRGRDVHTQLPPKEFSVSLNLMVKIPANRNEDQYEFDLQKQQIRGYVNPNARETLVAIASKIGNQSTWTLVEQVARRHFCPRTRAAAIRAMEEGGNGPGIWQEFLNDEAPLVRFHAKARAML